MKASLGLGCWAFGKDFHPDQRDADSVRTVHFALSRGITHFDTAQTYGRGTSEQITGQQVRRFRNRIPREKLTIATKLMITRHTDPLSVRRLVKKSIRRLCTSYIDICFIHWPVSGYDMRPVLRELDACRKEGLIRETGLSNFPADDLQALASQYKISWYQGPYSLLWRRPDEQLIPICRDLGIRFCAYSPLANGLLGGASAPEGKTHLLFLQDHIWKHLSPMIQEMKQTVSQISRLTPAQAALLWVLQQPGIDLVLTGARNRTQLEQVTAAAETDIQEDLAAYFDEFSRRCSLLLPQDEDNIFAHRWNRS